MCSAAALTFPAVTRILTYVQGNVNKSMCVCTHFHFFYETLCKTQIHRCMTKAFGVGRKWKLCFYTRKKKLLDKYSTKPNQKKNIIGTVQFVWIWLRSISMGGKSQIVSSVAQKLHCFIRKDSTNYQCRTIFISEV